MPSRHSAHRSWSSGGLGVGSTNGIDWIKVAIQVGLAAVGVSLYAGTRTKKGIRA